MERLFIQLSVHLYFEKLTLKTGFVVQGHIFKNMTLIISYNKISFVVILYIYTINGVFPESFKHAIVQPL